MSGLVEKRWEGTCEDVAYQSLAEWFEGRKASLSAAGAILRATSPERASELGVTVEDLNAVADFLEVAAATD